MCALQLLRGGARGMYCVFPVMVWLWLLEMRAVLCTAVHPLQRVYYIKRPLCGDLPK